MIFKVILTYLFIIIIVLPILNLILSYLSYVILRNKSHDVYNKRELNTIDYGFLPGSIISILSYHKCKDKFPISNGIHTVKQSSLLRTEYYNIFKYTHIDPTFICIKNEIIIPETYIDYLKIRKYLINEYLIPHNINRESRISNSCLYDSTYKFIYSLITGPYFKSPNLKDMVFFIDLPKKYSNNRFIFYDKNTRIIYLHGFIPTPVFRLVLLSYFKVREENPEYIDNLDYMVDLVNSEIINYTKILSSKLLYPLGYELNKAYISIMIHNYTTRLEDPKLVAFLRNWKGNNISFSYYRATPLELEISYEEAFGKPLNVEDAIT